MRGGAGGGGGVGRGGAWGFDAKERGGKGGSWESLLVRNCGLGRSLISPCLVVFTKKTWIVIRILAVIAQSRGDNYVN